MKKIYALLLALVMCFSLFGCGISQPVETSPATGVPVVESTAAPAEDIVILYTNDVHTCIDRPLSYDILSALRQELESTHGYVLLVDAGDHIQGTAFGTMDEGEHIVDLMNDAGYNVATFGNHEFDYGMDGTMNIIDWAEYDYLSSNFYHLENGVRGELVVPAYKTFSFGDQKIAFVGITTPESFLQITPGYIQDEQGNDIYTNAGLEKAEDLYDSVQTAIDEARGEGAQYVIGLGHLGTDVSSRPWTSEDVIQNVTGMDAFIDGHSHTVEPGRYMGDTLLTQTGEYFDRIGMMVIDGETGSITTDLISTEEILSPVLDDNGNVLLDEEENEVTEVTGYRFTSNNSLGELSWCCDVDLQDKKNAWIEEINIMLGDVIGWTNITLENYDAEGNRLPRVQETNTGDFSADALYYLFDDMGLDVDVAFMNGGGIRNRAITGELTYLKMKEIHTFGNVACLQKVTGQQILDALEWAVEGVESKIGFGKFLQVSGITFRVDTQWPSSVQADGKKVWIGAPTGGYRVCDVKVYNKETNCYEPLDLEATYHLAGYNYILRDMGDGYGMFSGAVNVLDYVMEDYLVLANYIQGFPDCTVDAANSPLLEKYPNMLLDYSDVNGCGRIVID